MAEDQKDNLADNKTAMQHKLIMRMMKTTTDIKEQPKGETKQ